MAGASKLPNGLTAKQEEFAKAFIEIGNAADAYRKAYNPNPKSKPETIWRSAHEVLHTPKVSARIAELQAQAAERHGVTVDRIIGELALLGFSNMGDFMKIDDQGVPRLDFKAMTRAKSAAISEMTVEEFTAKGEGGGEAAGIRKVRFKLHDKRGALVDLGKHLGMFKDIVEHTGKGGGPIEVKDVDGVEAARRIAYALGRAVGRGQASNADSKASEAVDG